MLTVDGAGHFTTNLQVDGNNTVGGTVKITGRMNQIATYLTSTKSPDTLKYNNYNTSVFCYTTVSVSNGYLQIIGYGNDGDYLEITNASDKAFHIITTTGSMSHTYTIYPLATNSTPIPMTIGFRSVGGYWSAISATIQ
jgi:hypothetical protein